MALKATPTPQQGASNTPIQKGVSATIQYLPFSGMSRFSQFKAFLPISREKFRQLVIAKKAPQPIRLGTRCTFYKNSELHAFFNDPLNYRAEV